MFTAVTARTDASNALLNSIQASSAVTAEERLDAYRANVRGAHFNALEQAFPVTREVLGARYWQRLLEQEIEILASTKADLHAYGDFVPGLLQAAQQRRPELEDFPYLTDLATLEWHVHRARFARDGPAFDWESFIALAPDLQAQAIFTPSWALKILDCRYPVDTIWRAHQAAEDAAPECESPAAYFIHRVDRFDVTVTRLNQESADLLVAICEGANLEMLSEVVIGKEPEAIIRLLFDWIRRGWIVGFEVR